MTPRNLNEEAVRCHAANIHWWSDLQTGERYSRNLGEMLMLVVSEFAEALEGDRKNLMDDKVPTRRMAEVELADALIRLLDIAGSMGSSLNLNKGHRYLLRWSPNFAENLLQLVKTVVSTTSADAGIIITIHGILELAERCKFDIWGAYESKMAYNAARADHKREARLSIHGKKY